MAIDARAFASALTGTDDESLARLFRRRGVAGDVAWRDVFDAADALLDPDSLRAALGSLPLAAAHALHVAIDSDDAVPAGDERTALCALGLIDADGIAYPSAADVVSTLALPGPELVVTRSLVDSPAAAEQALTTTASIADLLLSSYAHPVARIGTGAVGVAERRRLADSGVVSDVDDIDELIRIASLAGLVAAEEREWLVTPAAREWLESTNRDRWEQLAMAYVHGLPHGLVVGDALTPTDGWDRALPWSTTWPTEVEQRRRGARLLGLADDTGAATIWARTIDPDLDALTAHWPQEVLQVFLQNDLSVISPGPLAPIADLRLRSMASRESHAQASTYRFSAASIRAALSRGDTEESILAFLDVLSLTGIPQPLRYLVHESASRHGDITVGEDPETGRTRIIARTDAVRHTLLVDQALRPLGLAAEGDVLTTRVARDSVALALAEAHYPVAAVDVDGAYLPLRPGRIAEQPPRIEPDHAPLIARLRAATVADGDEAWLRRELELAVRDRATLEVTVTLPDGEERVFVLEASGLGGGRLRGRDHAADVERTLPLSHISGIRSAE